MQRKHQPNEPRSLCGREPDWICGTGWMYGAWLTSVVLRKCQESASIINYTLCICSWRIPFEFNLFFLRNQSNIVQLCCFLNPKKIESAELFLREIQAIYHSESTLYVFSCRRAGSSLSVGITKGHSWSLSPESAADNYLRCGYVIITTEACL